MRLAIVIGEIAADGDIRADELEMFKNDAHVDAFRRAVVAGQREGKREDSGEALEFVLGRFAQVDEVCVGKGEVLDAAIAHVGGDDDELIGVFIRKRAQQDGIGDAEDGGARADAQGNG